MRIWIDGIEANVRQRLGSGQVAFELLRNLYKLDQKNDYTILLSDAPLEDLPAERENWHYKIVRPARLRTRIGLPLAILLSKEKPDVFFSPTHYGPAFTKVKQVISIFDLAFVDFPEMFEKSELWKLVNWTKASVKRASKIITISESTKNHIVSEYAVARSKVTVAYPGHSEAYHQISDKQKIAEVINKYAVEGPYVLFIGTIQPRKNLLRLIESFRSLKGVKLVVVGKITGEGKQGWKYDEILRKPKEMGIENRVIFTGYVPDEDMPYLMNGATAFALPSLWEGFGIPVVDAMSCGVPVIVSNTSSLPEVAGDAGLFVDPKSVDHIEQALRLILTDAKLRQRKSKLGLEQAKKFSWEKMAKQVLKVLEEVGGHS